MPAASKIELAHSRPGTCPANAFRYFHEQSLRGQIGLSRTPVVAPTAAQFKKLVEVISRSQLNYRELIDSLDHAVFTVSLDGEIRVANRRLAEILGVCFQDLIGHRAG